MCVNFIFDQAAVCQGMSALRGTKLQRHKNNLPQCVNLSPVHLYTQEPDPNKATLAKVIPTPNNGFAELVALQRDQVSSHIYPQDAPGCLNWKQISHSLPAKLWFCYTAFDHCQLYEIHLSSVAPV